jgi:hypothetical protein
VGSPQEAMLAIDRIAKKMKDTIAMSAAPAHGNA